MHSAYNKHGPALLGVLNVTPDSFSDGGQYNETVAARARIDRLLLEGADVIDIGAESTRPGSKAISALEQVRRAEPSIRYAVEQGATVSIDTTLPQVAKAALDLGARIINDVSCLADAHLARLALDYDADLIIMHSRGAMSEMKAFSEYDQDAYGDVVAEVRKEWQKAHARAREQGLKEDRIWFDPGLGFHKNEQQSFALLRRLEELRDLGAGTLIGASRKSFIGKLDDSSPEERLGGSIAAALRATEAGAQLLRVHDVHATRQALLSYRAFKRGAEVPTHQGANHVPV